MNGVVLTLFSFGELRSGCPQRCGNNVLTVSRVSTAVCPTSRMRLLGILHGCTSGLGLRVLFAARSVSLLGTVSSLIRRMAGGRRATGRTGVLCLGGISSGVTVGRNIGFGNVRLSLGIITRKGGHGGGEVATCARSGRGVLFMGTVLGDGTFILSFISMALPYSALVRLMAGEIPTFVCPCSVIVLSKSIEVGGGSLEGVGGTSGVLVLPKGGSPRELLTSCLCGLSSMSPL